MHLHRIWPHLLSITICIVALVQPNTESGIEQTLWVEERFDDFILAYWAKGGWKGASSWTGDVLSRLMVSYLSSQGEVANHSKVNEIFAHVVSRSLSAWTLIQYLTQANDDFGWTVALLLEILEYTHEYEKRYPDTSSSARLPILRGRLAFRAAFLHDLMIESWTAELCHGGAEWYVRTRRRFVWPSLGVREIYKNTITNHLYNGNNAQIYNAYDGAVFPVGVIEIAVHGLRVLGKIIRPLFGGSRGHLRLFQFADVALLGRATKGINWMDQTDLLTEDSLYVDGIRPRFKQFSPDTSPTVVCDVRGEAVFTYNQVAGLRALYFLTQATGKGEFLRNGHHAIQNLIDATISGNLGWDGILEENCDRPGNCSQDMQAFKGVVFLEVQRYCRAISGDATREIRAWHVDQCRQYTPWIRTNAAAARSTIDNKGAFGGYWGIKHVNHSQGGRGRTIETQFSGLAAQLALSFFEKSFSE
ncbi:hypothetical protein LTR84_012025 [Exophiala bonariae]|uniref:Uncharacterized protein n=1 Tax=Exophiala bonariae TaxID=1690606 RepID=A0AAV9MU42_9EURO|nr:hypothetical protein LTR84_012025 [Exophiala bonariae]